MRHRAGHPVQDLGPYCPRTPSAADRAQALRSCRVHGSSRTQPLEPQGRRPALVGLQAWVRVSAERWRSPGGLPTTLALLCCAPMGAWHPCAGGVTDGWGTPSPQGGRLVTSALPAPSHRVETDSRACGPARLASLASTSREGGEGGGGSRSRPPEEGPPAFPIRKHILLVSGCYLLQLATPSSSPKTASKTTISSLLRDRGKTQARGTHTLTHTRTRIPAATLLLSRTSCSVAEAPGRGSGSGGPSGSLALLPAALLRAPLRTGPESEAQAPRVAACLASDFCSLHLLLLPGRRRAHDSGLSLVPLLPPRDGQLRRLQFRPGPAPGAGRRVRRAARRAPPHLSHGPS